MDRFVWFILLVVISHLVTEFTRVTGYTRWPRQDAASVNDSSIQHIKIQKLIAYPGLEYGLYEQRNQQYYNGSQLYSKYAINNNGIFNFRDINFLNNLFNQFANNTSQNGQQQQPEPYRSASILNFPRNDGDAKTFNFRPIIDNIFEIPMSTLRAVNDLLNNLIGGILHSPQPDHEQQEQLLPQQKPPKYTSYPSYATSAAEKSSLLYDATAPQNSTEVLKAAIAAEMAATSAIAAKQNGTTIAPIRKRSLYVSPQP